MRIDTFATIFKVPVKGHRQSTCTTHTVPQLKMVNALASQRHINSPLYLAFLSFTVDDYCVLASSIFVALIPYCCLCRIPRQRNLIPSDPSPRTCCDEIVSRSMPRVIITITAFAQNTAPHAALGTRDCLPGPHNYQRRDNPVACYTMTFSLGFAPCSVGSWFSLSRLAVHKVFHLHKLTLVG